MNVEGDAGVRLAAEIAHVLFLDVVSYSLGSMEEQARLSGELRTLVRGTPEFRRAVALGDLFGLDTGDGMALAFFRDPLAPVQCATEIARAVAARDDRLQLRMGIHSGPVSRVSDINGKENVSGSGINMAQRVMDAGDAGHILLSSASAEVVREFEAWASCLRDLGECVVKHGVKLHLFNLLIGEIGNPACPGKLAPSAEFIVKVINEPAKLPPPTAAGAGKGVGATRESVGGAVPLESKFYVVRPTDDEFCAAIARRDSIVLVKGARQTGKTSLLARGLQQAREAGARVVLTDFQTLSAADLASADALYQTFAETLADQLNLDTDPVETWNGARGPSTNLERFLRRDMLSAIDGPLVWGLDEVDRLFSVPFGSEVFGLFRSWHNKRALDPSGPWSRMTLAIAYATEAHLFITDLNQSPFNVGTRLALDDFDPSHVGDLNGRYGLPLAGAAEVARFHDLLGGQPYLTRRGLDEMSARGLDLATFEAEADRDEGLFGDHLRRILLGLSHDAELAETTHAVLAGRPIPSPDAFYRLRSAGVLSGGSASEARFRCRLYATYLARHLT